MRVLAGISLLLMSCSFVGFDDLETTPCIVGPDRSVESFARANALCAELEAEQPAGDGLAWVCREPVGDDLFCVIDRPDADNDGVGAGDGSAEGGLDCDDSDPTVFGGREETECDGKDNDCDGNIDENLFVAGTYSPILADVPAAASLVRGLGDTSRASAVSTRDGFAVILNGTELTRFSEPASLFAAAPNGDGTDAVVLRRPGSTAFVHLTSRMPPLEEDSLLAGESLEAPTLATSGDGLLAAWYDAPSTLCGGEVGVRIASGRLSGGAAGELSSGPAEFTTASTVQGPSIVPSGDGVFTLGMAVGSALTLTDVIVAPDGTSTVGATGRIDFGTNVGRFAVARVDESGRIGVFAVDCSASGGARQEGRFALLERREDAFVTLLEAPILVSNEEVPALRVALTWASTPGVFVAAWQEFDGLRYRLISGEGVPSVDSQAIVGMPPAEFALESLEDGAELTGLAANSLVAANFACRSE